MVSDLNSTRSRRKTIPEVAVGPAAASGLWPPSYAIMVLSVWSPPAPTPTGCPPVRRRPASSLAPRDRPPLTQCQPSASDARTYTGAQMHTPSAARTSGRTHALTASHKSNPWCSSLPSQHAPWLLGCRPTSNSCYLRAGGFTARTHTH